MGQGDASGLRVTDARRPVGSLICWENYMPLARYALYADGVEIYVAATWDEGDSWIATMRHIAAEGRCWVIGAGCSLRACDVPSAFPGREQLFPDQGEWRPRRFRRRCTWRRDRCRPAPPRARVVVRRR